MPALFRTVRAAPSAFRALFLTRAKLAPMRRSEVLRASPPMFKTRWLDPLSRVHPAVPVVIFLPAIAVLAVLALGRMEVLPALAWLAGGDAFCTVPQKWIPRGIFK